MSFNSHYTCLIRHLQEVYGEVPAVLLQTVVHHQSGLCPWAVAGTDHHQPDLCVEEQCRQVRLSLPEERRHSDPAGRRQALRSIRRIHTNKV